MSLALLAKNENSLKSCKCDYCDKHFWDQIHSKSKPNMLYIYGTVTSTQINHTINVMTTEL